MAALVQQQKQQGQAKPSASKAQTVVRDVVDREGAEVGPDNSRQMAGGGPASRQQSQNYDDDRSFSSVPTTAMPRPATAHQPTTTATTTTTTLPVSTSVPTKARSQSVTGAPTKRRVEGAGESSYKYNSWLEPQSNDPIAAEKMMRELNPPRLKSSGKNAMRKFNANTAGFKIGAPR